MKKKTSTTRKTKPLNKHGVMPSLPLARYHLTLKSLRSKIDGAKHADSVNERNWHLGLAEKIIREELYLHPLKGNGA